MSKNDNKVYNNIEYEIQLKGARKAEKEINPHSCKQPINTK